MIFTSYYFNKNSFDQAIAYTSVTITIAILQLIILCHVYTYTNLFSKVKKTRLGRKIDELLTLNTDTKPKPRQYHHNPLPDDDNYHNRFDDRQLLDELDYPVYTHDYDTTPLTPVEPTFSVDELPIPKKPMHRI